MEKLKISKQFYDSVYEVIAIYRDTISNVDRYFPEEIDVIHSFENSKVNEYEDEILLKIMRVSLDYHYTIDVRNPPPNVKDLVDELLARLDIIQNELNSIYGS